MRRGLPWAITLIGFAAVGLGVARYQPFLADDALISLRYSRRLLDGHGLTWTDGTPVEGYSNPTWVLAVAGLGLLGIDLVVAARLLGVTATAAAIVALVWWFRPSRPARALPALAAVLSTALAGPIAVWTIGGLEQPLIVALLAWATVLLLRLLDRPDPTAAPTRTLVGIGGLYGVLAVSRPDAGLFAVVAAGCLVAIGRFGRSGWRAAGLLLAVPIVLLALQVGYRLHTYDDWVPNTAYAKVALSPVRVREGLDHVGGGLVAMIGLALPAVAAVVGLHRRPVVRRRLLLLSTSLGAWLAYVVVVGGDTFPGRRPLAAAVVLMALLGGELWRELAQRPDRASQRRAWALAGLAVVAVGAGQLADPQNGRAGRERWEWHCRDVARTIGRSLADEQPLFAVTTAGCLPYWSELPSLDLLGLNDRYLAHHRPPTMGDGALGHELGDADYVFRRGPDLMSFCGPDGSAWGCHDADRALVARPELHERYRLVPLEVHGDDDETSYALLWVRRAGGTLGARLVDGVLVVPGLQFGDAGAALPRTCVAGTRSCLGTDPTIVVPGAGGGLVARIEPGASASARVAAPAGRWRVELSADRSGGVVSIRDARSGRLLVDRGDAELVLPAAAEVVVTVAAPKGGRAVALSELRLVPA